MVLVVGARRIGTSLSKATDDGRTAANASNGMKLMKHERNENVNASGWCIISVTSSKDVRILLIVQVLPKIGKDKNWMIDACVIEAQCHLRLERQGNRFNGTLPLGFSPSGTSLAE